MMVQPDETQEQGENQLQSLTHALINNYYMLETSHPDSSAFSTDLDVCITRYGV